MKLEFEERATTFSMDVGEVQEVGGGMSPEEVQGMIDKSIAAIVEKDPTVPEWAKQPTKPTYTAEEVGALSEHQDISGKADKVDTYTKEETETAINNAIGVVLGGAS